MLDAGAAAAAAALAGAVPHSITEGIVSYTVATPTLKDLAAATGVSISTVSRALANHPAISQATTKKVKDAAEKLGYRPNAHIHFPRTFLDLNYKS